MAAGFSAWFDRIGFSMHNNSIILIRPKPNTIDPRRNSVKLSIPWLLVSLALSLLVLVAATVLVPPSARAAPSTPPHVLDAPVTITYRHHNEGDRGEFVAVRRVSLSTPPRVGHPE